MENKSLWQLLKGTLMGTDNEGSAKRATGFWLTIIILTSLVIVEEYCYIIANKALIPTTAQMVTVNSHTTIIGSVIVTGLIYGGLTSVDKLIDLFKFIKGGNNNAESTKSVEINIKKEESIS